MWIASTFNRITAEAIDQQFTGGDGQKLQKLVRALVLLELDALGVSRPHDVRQTRVGPGRDGGVDLKYVPAATTVSQQGTVVSETSGELWFSCKATDGWLDSVLRDLDSSKASSKAEAKRIADHLAASASARFVIVTSCGGDLAAELGKARKHPGKNAGERIEHCLQQSDDSHQATAFRSQIQLVTAVDIASFLQRHKPGNLSPDWLRALGVREVKGWESVEELGGRFLYGERRSRASFVDDGTRQTVRDRVDDAIANGRNLVVCGPPGIGKTRAVYEALGHQTTEQRDRVSTLYAPRLELLNEAIREGALECSNVALVVDDLTASDLPLVLDAIRRKQRGEGTSVVLVVSAPEAVVSDKLQSANASIEVVSLGRLEDHARQRLLREEYASARGASIDDDALRRLAKLSDGYPWFAVLLAPQRDTPRTQREAIERAMTDDEGQRETYWAALLLAVMMRESALSSLGVSQRQCLATSLGVADWNSLRDAVKRLRAKAIVRPYETPDGEQAITYVSPAIFAREVIVRELIEDTKKLEALRECFAQGLERVLDSAEDYELTEDERRTLAETIVRSMETRPVTIDALADPDAPLSKLLRQLATAAPARTASWLASLVEQTADDQLVARVGRMLAVVAALTVAWRRDTHTFDTVEPALRRLGVFDQTPFLNNARHQWVRLFAEEPDPTRPIEPRLERFEAVVRTGSARERILATDVCFAWTANDNYLRAWTSTSMSDAITARSEAQHRVVECFLLLLSDPVSSVSDAARARLNDVLGARRSTNPWLARVSQQLAERVVAWSEAQRSALLAALRSRRTDRGYQADDPAAIAALEAALRPQTRSERLRELAQRLRWEPSQSALDPALESALDELIAANAEEFAAELRWTDANDEVLGVRRVVYALGVRDQAGACAARVDQFARESPGSTVPAMYFVGREVGGTALSVIDETIRAWSEGPMVLARLTYLAQSRVDSDARIEWLTTAARSSAPDLWFERFLLSAALLRADGSAQSAIMDALLDGESATRAALVLQLCATRSNPEDSARIRRALEALARARRWPALVHDDWLAAVLRLVTEDDAWTAAHVVQLAVSAVFDVPAPPVDRALREWPEAHSDVLWNAIVAAFREDDATQLAWALRDSALVQRWAPRILEWVGADRKRALWVTRWLFVVEPKHEALLAELAQRRADDRGFMDELRSSIETVIALNPVTLTGATRAVLERHIERCTVGEPAWGARVRERLDRTAKPERAA
jgi:hypothetical protein